MVKSCEEVEKTVTIPEKEYYSLLQDSDFLECLKACGVDNWARYSEACEMFDESEQES